MPRTSGTKGRGATRGPGSRHLALAMTFLLAICERASGDGGAVLLRGTDGGLEVTLFGEPAPLRVGEADLSVLVQDAASGATVLDGEIAVLLVPPAGSPLPEMRARPDVEHARNKLLRAATVRFDATGPWRAQVEVSSGGRRARVEATIEVARAQPAIERLWPWLALPFVASALFAWREWLRLGRRRVGTISGRTGSGSGG